MRSTSLIRCLTMPAADGLKLQDRLSCPGPHLDTLLKAKPAQSSPRARPGRATAGLARRREPTDAGPARRTLSAFPRRSPGGTGVTS